MPAPPISHPQSMMWEVTAHDANFSMNTIEEDASNPAGDVELRGINLDDQIKAYEAFQAAQARHMQELEEKRRLRSRRKVQFHEDLLLYSSSLSLSDVSRMWYSRDELGEFKNERKQIVRVLKRANFDVEAVERNGKNCLRGYEAYFSIEVNKAMKHARTAVTSIVLSEQNQQRSNDVYFDDEAMRYACCDYSHVAVNNALSLASKDEYDVYIAEDDCSMDEHEEDAYDMNNFACHTSLENVEPIPFVEKEDLTMQDAYTTTAQQQELIPRPETAIDGETESDNNLVETLESAMRLVQALRYGSSSPRS